jgi:hypothetical protein
MKTPIEKRITRRRGFALTLCSLAAIVSGCAWEEPDWESADFGDAVRQNIALQTEYPGSAGTGMDAQKAANVMQAYREDVAKPEQAERDIRFRVAE